jgi:large subunit ribosomal protein L9
MKVILLTDVKGIGKKDQVVEVKDGYGSNYLIPHKLAVTFTDSNIQELKKKQEDEAKKQEELKQQAIVLKDTLSKIQLEFKVKSSKDGRMCGTISYKQVEAELLAKYGIKVDKRKIVSTALINAFGITNLEIELYKGVIANIKVHVSEEK